MVNNVTFNMDGPTITGHWYNTKTGDSFTVRDSFFEDNQLFIQATDGRVFGYEQLQDYIQSKEKIEMPKPQTNNIPMEVMNELEDDFVNLNKPLGNIYNDIKSEPIYNEEKAILDRTLTKKSKPKSITKIDWKNFPLNEIQFLNESMDIDMNIIIDWYLEQIDMNEIKNEVSKSIESFIKNSFKKEEPKPEPKPSKTKGGKK